MLEAVAGGPCNWVFSIGVEWFTFGVVAGSVVVLASVAGLGPMAEFIAVGALLKKGWFAGLVLSVLVYFSFSLAFVGYIWISLVAFLVEVPLDNIDDGVLPTTIVKSCLDGQDSGLGIGAHWLV